MLLLRVRLRAPITYQEELVTPTNPYRCWIRAQLSIPKAKSFV